LNRKVSAEELRHKQFQVLQFFKEGLYKRHSLNLKEMTKILPKDFRLRDLRGTHGRQISQILVRDGHFWVIVEHLMAVVTEQNVVLFRADSQNVMEFAEQLSDILKINARSVLVPSYPFELVVLEEILSAVVQEFDHRMNILLPVVQEILRTFTSGDNHESVVRIIPMTNTLTNFQTAITELRSAIEDVLQSENDLSNMCLTNKERSTRMEVEMLLENFSKKTEELNNEIQENFIQYSNHKKSNRNGNEQYKK